MSHEHPVDPTHRSLWDGAVAVAIYALAIYLVAILLYYALTLTMDATRYVNFFLGPGLALFYLNQYRTARLAEESEAAIEEGSSRGPVASRLQSLLDASRLPVGTQTWEVSRLYPLVALAAVAVTVYVELNFERIRLDVPLYGMNSADLLVGALLILIVLHATKVAFGWAIFLTSVVSILYGFAGPWMPGILFHTGIGAEQLVYVHVMSFGGVFGFITEIGVTYVAIFIVFAGMARSFGLLDYIMDIGREFGRLFKSGVVHAAVISSFLVGSLTGAAAANTVTTGGFTIPMMKRQGVDGNYAGAIESVASSGSQVMPPVMGVAAFLMSSILGIPYLEVITGALLPALVFYVIVAVGAHLFILKHGWTVERTDERFAWSVFRGGVHYVLPLVVLIYALVVVRMTPLSAGLYTIAALFLVHGAAKLVTSGFSRGNAVETGREYVEGTKEGALEMAPLIGVLGALGIIVEMVTRTGLSQRLSSQIIGLSGGVFILLLFFAMLTSIIFGLGMPTPAAYILVVFLAAPALTEFGVQPLTAHMFVFYFAMLSAITPPVAICVAIASRIADSSFVETSKQALRLGGPIFLLPYVFVINDSLIYWSMPETLFTFVFVLGGFAMLSIALIAFNGSTAVSPGVRVLYLAIGVALFAAPLTAQVALLVAGALLFLVDVRVLDLGALVEN